MTADLCSPDVLSHVADLELVARIIVDGLVSGSHRSPFHGYSAEFNQYRHYRPGDDLKYVDWKLAARTGRVYTKQFREITNMAVVFVIDSSASMVFPLRGASKLRYAVIASAALAYLLSRQGDAVGLLASGERGDVFVPARDGRSHLRRVLAALTTIERGSTSWQPAQTIRRAADRLTRRGMLIVLSDFYDGEDAVFLEFRRASRMGHEVVLFQIISRDELDFPYRHDLDFADLETGQTVAVNAGRARAAYKDALAAFLERCRTRAAGDGLGYSLVVTDTPPARALRNFLLARR